MPQSTAAVPSEAQPPQVVQIIYQIVQQPQPVYLPGQDQPGQQPAYLSYVIPETGAGGGTTVAPHTVTVPNPSLALLQQGGGGVGVLPPPPPQPQPMEQGRAQPVMQQQQQEEAAAAPASYGAAAGGGAETQPPVPAWGQQPPYQPPPPPPPFRVSSGSAVWGLFLLIPALLLMVIALGQDVFADDVIYGYAYRIVYLRYRSVSWEYSPPRVMLWNVEKCRFTNESRISCRDMSFDDAKSYDGNSEKDEIYAGWRDSSRMNATGYDTSLISTACTGYVISTAVMVILSALWIPVCIVLGIQEVRGKEPFPYACAAATVVGLLFTGLSWGLPVGAIERNVCTYTAVFET